MTLKTNLKLALSLLFGMGAIDAIAANDMHWFNNEMSCAGTKVTVQSYCKNDDDRLINTFCTRQKMILQDANGKEIVKSNLLEKEPARKEFHVLGSMRCVSGKDDKPYLYMILDNSGNCDACEINAIMDLNGKWKRYDKKWFVSGVEKRAIQKHSKDWFKSEAFYLKNKIEIK